MTEYVAGFLVNPNDRTVALIRKGKPEWQRGKLNGIGGKIEPDEAPVEAMCREFHEEAGLWLDDWDHFATVAGGWGAVYFFRTFSTATPRTMESEPIEIHAIDSVPYAECIPNLSWLIPLALYAHDRYEAVPAREIVKQERQGVDTE